jgi:release factor glutamine methyltransferase
VQLDSTIDISIIPEVYNPSDDSYLLLKMVDVRPGEAFLEMGSGSGLLAVHAAKVEAKVTAADLNPSAVECTKRNAVRNGVRVEVVLSDLFERVPGLFDAIAFNPPYLPSEGTSTSWMEKAWSGGEEGSETAIRFLGEAWRHLAPGGRIYMILSSIGGFMSVLKSSKERYEATMLLEQHMFFESIFAYKFTLKSALSQ